MTSRCPVELTGRYSVTPSTTPSTTAFQVVICESAAAMSVACRRRRAVGRRHGVDRRDLDGGVVVRRRRSDGRRTWRPPTPRRGRRATITGGEAHVAGAGGRWQGGGPARRRRYRRLFTRSGTPSNVPGPSPFMRGDRALVALRVDRRRGPVDHVGRAVDLRRRVARPSGPTTRRAARRSAPATMTPSLRRRRRGRRPLVREEVPGAVHDVLRRRGARRPAPRATC